MANEKATPSKMPQLRVEVNEALNDVFKALAVCTAMRSCHSSDQDALCDVAHDYLDRITCRLNQLLDELEALG